MLFFAYILIAILFWRLVLLANRVDQLESGLARMRAATPVATPAEPPPTAMPIVVRPTPPAPAPAPVPPPPAPVFAKPLEPKPEPIIAAPDTSSLEELIGGNILNKLGALVLVIGIALFLNYSFANMGPAGRVATGVVISAALLATGAFIETKDRYKIFARGLLASGWAGLYFTSYAAYALPAAKVIDNPIIGTLLMVAVAILMVLRSLRYKVQSLTALAFGCIFAALAVSEITTFATIALVPLAASMLYLARRFEWHELALFAATGTYGVFLTRPDTGAPLAGIQTMLFIYWAMFEAFDLLRLNLKKPAAPTQHLLFAINALAGLAASGVIWFNKAPDSMWIFCAGASVLYLASTWLRYALEGETLYEFSLGISAVLAGLAIFAKVEGIWTSIAFMLEAETLFLVALRLRIPVAKILSWAAFVAALRSVLEHVTATPTLVAGFEIQVITPPLLILSALLYLNRYLDKEEPYGSYFASFIAAGALAYQTDPSTLISVTMLTFAGMLFAFGRRTQLPEFRYQSYAIALFSILTAPWPNIAKHPPADVVSAFATIAIAGSIITARLLRSREREFETVRFVACTAASLVAFVTLWMLLPGSLVPLGFLALATLVMEAGIAESTPDVLWIGRILSLFAAFQLLFDAPADMWQRVAIASAVAAGHYFIRFRIGREPLPHAHALLATSIVTGTIFNEVSGGMLTLSWSLEGIALLAAGFALRDRWLRLPGLSLLMLCIAKVFVYDLRNLETIYRILSFIGLGLILLGVSFIYTRFKEQINLLL